jgi:hypothetical protein
MGVTIARQTLFFYNGNSFPLSFVYLPCIAFAAFLPQGEPAFVRFTTPSLSAALAVRAQDLCYQHAAKA